MGELDAKRPERASTLTIYSWNEVFYMYTIKTLNAISPVGLAKLPKNQFDVSVDADAPDGILVRSADLLNTTFNLSLIHI